MQRINASMRGSQIVLVFGLLLFWELFYYTGLIDPSRFSHPLGALMTLMDPNFLTGFGIMLLQVFSLSLIGGFIGVAVGALIFCSSWLTRSTIRFLRVGLWAPFFIFLAFPFTSEYIVSGVLTIGVTAISLFGCNYFLTICLSRRADWQKALPEGAKETILQALLFSLFSQVQSGLGWIRFFFQKQQVDVLYAALILLLLFVFLLNRVFRSSFDNNAQVRGTILLTELADKRSGSIWGVILLGVACLILWQIFSDLLGRYLLVSHPLDVIRTAFQLLFKGTDLTLGPIWTDIGVSVLELFAGLVLGGGMALITFSCLYTNVTLRTLTFIPMTHVVPIIVPMILPFFSIKFLGSLSLSTTLCVALLSFFPFVRVLWGLRDHQRALRLLLAVIDALPFAFVAMLFGELMGSVAGLGFLMVKARSVQRLDDAMAIALLTLSVFIVLSSTVRLTAKRLYFSPGEKRR